MHTLLAVIMAFLRLLKALCSLLTRENETKLSACKIVKFLSSILSLPFPTAEEIGASACYNSSLCLLKLPSSSYYTHGFISVLILLKSLGVNDIRRPPWDALNCLTSDFGSRELFLGTLLHHM